MKLDEMMERRTPWRTVDDDRDHAMYAKKKTSSYDEADFTKIHLEP